VLVKKTGNGGGTFNARTALTAGAELSSPVVYACRPASDVAKVSEAA